MAPATTRLTGVAAKGPLKSALVPAVKVNDAGTPGDEITEKETDANGGYTRDLGTYSGAVQLVVKAILGKTKASDEATGLDQARPDDFKLHANRVVVVVVAAAGGNQIQNASITPLTELAPRTVTVDSGGLSKANTAAASKVVFVVVFDLIGVDPVATQALDSTMAPPVDATDDEKRYALHNAAISQRATGATASTDPITRQCFTAAAGNAGQKIKCATDQLARSATITPGNIEAR